MRHNFQHADPLVAVTFAAGALLLLAACRPIHSAPPAAADPMPVVESVGAGDALTVTVENSVTQIDIISERGIGVAQIRFPQTTAITLIVVRFHLQALEQASFDNGQTRLEISLSSNPPYTVSQTLITDAGAESINADDERWAAVVLAPDEDAAPSIPLQGGYIVVTLPAGFVDEEISHLALRWIDFYR